jgi:chromosome segregation ATPase
LAEKDDAPETLDQRIAHLADSLAAASESISAVEAEIESRKQLVEELERDARTHEKLLRLRKSEVEAVAQTLRGELVREGRHSFRLGLAQNAVFFVLGAIASVALALLFGQS